MDRSWIEKPRYSLEYLRGVIEFVKFVFRKGIPGEKIYCPCKKCTFGKLRSRKDVIEDLICNGMILNYTTWYLHGETSSSYAAMNENTVIGETDVDVDMHDLVHDVFGRQAQDDVGIGSSHEARGELDVESQKFYKLLRDAEQDLYPSCKKFSKLSFIVQLFHIKVLYGWSNKSFDVLVELIKKVLPEGEVLPKNFYETKKIIKELGLYYDKIDACPNDCMLYWKERATETSCAECGTSRWKIEEHRSDDEETPSCRQEKKILVKVLRHFPLKPRLQRLFMSSKIASLMTCHVDDRQNDGVLRHPADSPAWQAFDGQYPHFAAEPRNVRLGLASDGFNPFRTMSIAHSTWPVLLMPYNLPPWLCRKQPNIILSLLIPGPLGPGNNIDVYLQPLIDELKELWEYGTDTYDASKKEMFRMRATLLWTISDFPGYAYLSGWSTHGRLACPTCNKDTCSLRLKHGNKFCYMGHRRFLPVTHRFRIDKRSFNNEEELRGPPDTPVYGPRVLEQLQGISFTLGKIRRRVGKGNLPLNWKKKSIFFDLPYWESLMVRHNLDVMHIEKNICDNVVGTLLNLKKKTKDNLKARKDLKEMGIRNDLHPMRISETKVILPPASFTMKKEEKEAFCKLLKQVKVPDGYAVNISRCVNIEARKISGLKSHDCHVLMQQLLPLAVRRTLPKNVSSVIIELCGFFRDLCSKTATSSHFMELEERIALTLCQLEKIFPPAFFDVMVHLPVHLAEEARLARPVQYRWMYPIERDLLTLKSYVRNRSHPEGSITEGYLAEECLTFCSRYLEGVESKLNRPCRNDDDRGEGESEGGWDIFSQTGRPLGSSDAIYLDDATLTQAHQYVLFNCDAVNPYTQTHKELVMKQNPRTLPKEVERIHNRDFPRWFKEHVTKMHNERDELATEKLKWLAGGPCSVVKRYKGYLTNGFRFQTKDREKKRKTQNSGVVLKAQTSSFASARDRNPILGDITYYRVLTDIFELDYYEHLKALIFKCNWVNPFGRDSGIKTNELGFTLVNFKRPYSTNEPFVLASQVEQVFYVQDPMDKDWHVVRKIMPRDFFNMQGEAAVNDVNTYAESEPLPEGQSLGDIVIPSTNDDSWSRVGVDGIEVLLTSFDDDSRDDSDPDDGDGDDADDMLAN